MHKKKKKEIKIGHGCIDKVKKLKIYLVLWIYQIKNPVSVNIKNKIIKQCNFMWNGAKIINVKA